MSHEAAVQLVRFAELTPAAWRNGGGTTRVLLVQPGTSGDESFDWRISVANVAADGSFSTFVGVDRTLVMCGGAGMLMLVDGARRLLRRFESMDFPGEAHTSVQLVEGPTVDLNVMTARETTRSTLSICTVAGRTSVRSEPGGTTVLVALEGGLGLQGDQGAAPATVQLQQFDAVRLSGPAAVELSGHGRVARIDLQELARAEG